ncbi:MAG: sulfotransferase [Pseudomonadota bacterium]
MIEIVYVLGSTRSGTSALRNGLAETRFAGYGEGHLVPILQDMIRAVRSHKSDGLGAQVEGNGLHQMRENVMLRHLFHGYEQYLATQIKTNSLMDKTPTIAPIQLAPDLDTFHQKPYFIHCARRHLDNVQSKIKKFPDRTLEQHCREWAECNMTWLRVKDRLGSNYLAFDFYDLATDPERIAGQIGTYLELSAEDTAALGAYLVSKRPQAAADRDLTQFLRLSEIDWTDDEKQIFDDICSPVGELLGYGMEDYFHAPVADVLSG